MPDVCITDDVDGGVISGGDGPVVEVRQTPAGILETKLIHLVIADRPCVLKNAGCVAVGLLRGAGICVLTDGLALAVDFNSVHRAGADIPAQREAVVVGEVMVQAQRIQAGALKDREIPALRTEILKCPETTTNRGTEWWRQ